VFSKPNSREYIYSISSEFKKEVGSRPVTKNGLKAPLDLPTGKKPGD